MQVYSPDIYQAAADAIGTEDDVVVNLVDITLTLLRWATLPLGASLIAAAVIVQTLVGEAGRDHGGSVADSDADHH